METRKSGPDISLTQDVDMFRFEPQLSGTSTRPAANDAETMPVQAETNDSKMRNQFEMLAQSQKYALQVAEDIARQFWTLALASNLYLAVFATTLYAKPETRDSE